MKCFNPRSLAIVCFVFNLGVSAVLACPKISGFPDLNADGEITVVTLGDSLVFGFGDTTNSNRGGYVLRASRQIPGIDFINLGVAGQRTFELLDMVDDLFSKGGAHEEDARAALLKADLIVMDLGRNDRWLFGTPEAAYRNLKRIRAKIESAVSKETGIKPLLVTAVIMLPNRGSQGPWVKALDEIILRGNRAKAPADLRFDLVSKRLLSDDQIHPTPAGYTALAKVFTAYLKKNFPKHGAFYCPGDVPGVVPITSSLE